MPYMGKTTSNDMRDATVLIIIQDQLGFPGAVEVLAEEARRLGPPFPQTAKSSMETILVRSSIDCVGLQGPQKMSLISNHNTLWREYRTVLVVDAAGNSEYPETATPLRKVGL